MRSGEVVKVCAGKVVTGFSPQGRAELDAASMSGRSRTLKHGTTFVRSFAPAFAAKFAENSGCIHRKGGCVRLLKTGLGG